MNQDGLRKIIKIFFKEIGIVLFFALISLLIAFIVYQYVYQFNKPHIISEVSQERFSSKFYEGSRNSGYEYAFGDIKLEYLGDYKYDYRITSSHLLHDINSTRLYLLKEVADTYFHYVGWIIFIILAGGRYLILFFKWLYPKKSVVF